MAKNVEQLENTGGISEDLMLKVITLKNKLEDSSVNGKVKDGESQTSQKRHIPGSQDVGKQDNNGNVLSYEENCPFDTICDFLQALITKKYKKALRICKIILSFEPGNEIANEFLHVLEEMVTVNDDIRDGGASETTQLGRFYGSGDGRGDDSIEEKNDGNSSRDNEDSSDDSISSGDSSDEQSGDSTSSSSSDTESSDEDSSSSEGEADSQDPLEKICNSLNEEESCSSSSGEEDEDGESETSSSGSSLSSHDSAGDSEEEDYHQDTSARLDTEISALIEHFQGTYGSLDIQDTFDMVSSLDLEEEDEEEEETNKFSGGGEGGEGGRHLELNEGESNNKPAVELAKEERG